MTQPELPALPIGHTVGCGDLNGQKVLTKPEVIAYATAAVLAERERYADIVASAADRFITWQQADQLIAAIRTPPAKEPT